MKYRIVFSLVMVFSLSWLNFVSYNTVLHAEEKNPPPDTTVKSSLTIDSFTVVANPGTPPPKWFATVKGKVMLGTNDTWDSLQVSMSRDTEVLAPIIVTFNTPAPGETKDFEFKAGSSDGTYNYSISYKFKSTETTSPIIKASNPGIKKP